MSQDAILGTFVKIGTMADGTPRIVLDLQCTLSEIADMGLIPGVPFALARISKQASIPKAIEPKEKPGQLCIMACTFCADPMFWKWASKHYVDDVENELEAREFILEICDIKSRKELDKSSHAASAFHTQIRIPFLACQAEREFA